MSLPARPRILFFADAGPEVGGGHVMRCLTHAAIASGEAFSVLGENPISKCPRIDQRATATTARYRIRCPGPNSASAEASFETNATGYSGTIAMQMGGKNMTMSETQVAVRVGDCTGAGQ